MTLTNARMLFSVPGFLRACSTGRQATDPPGPFDLAARSRVGASIDEVTAMWGQPARIGNEQAVEGQGLAHWRFGWRDVFGASQSKSHRCAVDAYIAETRFIGRIGVF